MANPTNLFTQPFANIGDKNIIPNTATAGTGTMNQAYGFPTECSLPPGHGGIAPKRKDFNGAFYMLSAFAMMAQRGGIWQYESTVAYEPPAFIQDKVNSNYYICIAAVTGTAPSDDDGTHWKKILNSDGTMDVALLKDVTATAAELNILDGLTATTQELNYCDGVTSNIQTQLDSKLGGGLTGGRAIVTDTDGSVIASPTTATEISYLSGLLSNAQTQLNNITNAYDLGEQKNSVFDPNCTNLGTISSSSDMATFLADYHVTTGKFGNLKLNQCITINGSSLSDTAAEWLIAGFNFYYNVGSSNVISKPHLALIPKTDLGSAAMNSTNTTTGGYVGSAMHTTVMAAETTRLNNVLGSYLLSCDRLLTNGISTSLYDRFGSASGATNGWAWTNTKCELMTEVNVFGAQPWSSSGHDTGEGCRQLPIFRYITHNRYARSYFWLRSVVSSTYFAFASGDGLASHGGASASLGVRPLIFVG